MSFNNYNLKEQWKYTNINNFKNFKFDFLSKNINIKTQTDDIYIKNHNFTLSQNLNKSIIVKDLDKSIHSNEFNIKELLDKTSSSDLNPFINKNKQHYKNGILIHINDNSKIKNPIVIKCDMDENKQKSFLNTRIFFSIGRNVEAKILINDNINSICYLNTLVEMFIEESSNIKIVHLSQKSKTTQIYNFVCSINQNSSLNINPIDITGKFIKKNYFISLNGENSNINFNSLNLLSDNNHIDNYINIDHLNHHTYSSTKHKNILQGSSKSIFYAKSIVNKNSYLCEAVQKNNNLLLSDKAVVHSNPQLEIYNNDVKCSHGSTTGEIDEEILFYMQSRGLNKNECKKIILHGFANEITNLINDIMIEKKANQKIKKWLDHVS